MFRKRSSLGAISALLLLTTQCVAFKCRTCAGKECQQKDVETRECTKFSTMLPSFDEAYPLPLLSKLREKLLYACLKLEFHYGKSTRMLEKCIITENVDTVCLGIAESIPYTYCAVQPPPLINRRTVSTNPVQLHANILLNNDKSDFKHKIYVNLKHSAVTPRPKFGTTDPFPDITSEIATDEPTEAIISDTNVTYEDQSDDEHRPNPEDFSEHPIGNDSFTIENSASSVSTTIPNVIIEAENPSPVIPEPTATESTVAANENAMDETDSSHLDDICDASLGCKVEFNFVLFPASFIMYLVL